MTAISLADEPAFMLGDLAVRPALRQVVCAGASEHILEPRVMQVLVALAKAQGGIVSRDKLIEQCWEGRIVGEDAINRVIGRLRQFAQADAAGAFRIETVPRVGYRLLLRDQAEQQGIAPPIAAPAAPDRRALLIGGSAAAIIAAGGIAWWLTRPASPPPLSALSPEVQDLMQHAIVASRRGTPEGGAEAIGLLTRVVEMAPNYAPGWGGLALINAFLSRGNPAKTEAYRLQAVAALQRAVALDPHDALAYGARAVLLPGRGAWLERERIAREGLRYHPDADQLWGTLAGNFASVGRMREAAQAMDHAVAVGGANDPELVWFQIQSLWAANRLQEADAASVRGIAILPRQSSVWFSRFFLLQFTGRLDEAIAFLNDVDNRPPGIPVDEFDYLLLVTAAMKSRATADVEKAITATMEHAGQGGGYGENALMLLSALGRVDDAFAVADALYFNRGFTIGPLRFSAIQGAYTPLADRRTRHLFLPPTRPMRRDPRFLPLVTELGMTGYWHKAGVKPDYQAGADG